MVFSSAVRNIPWRIGRETSWETTLYILSTILERSALGSSMLFSGTTSGNAGQSVTGRTVRWYVDFWQVSFIPSSSCSKVMAASGRFFTIVCRTLAETTVSPSSSTLAATLCLMETVRSFDWSSRVPSWAFRYTPERIGNEGFDPIPFITISRAVCNEDWLTVKFITFPSLYNSKRKRTVVIISFVEM